MNYSEVAAYGVNPEEFLNPFFIDTKEQYEAMLENVKDHKIVILDSETVGNQAVDLFLQQLEFEKKATDILEKDPEGILGGLELLEEQKSLVKEFEKYLIEKHGLKTLTLTNIDPDERELLKERRKNLSDAKKMYADSIEYEKNIKKVKSIQNKIELDKSGLFFNRNQLGLVQLGTMTAQQFLIDPKVIDQRFNEFLRTRTAIVGMNLKFDLIQLHHHIGLDLDDVPVICYDVMLAAKMVMSGKLYSYSLKNLAKEILGYEQSKEEQLSYWLRRPLKTEQRNYAAMDVITPGLMFHILKKEIKEQNLTEVAKMQMDFLKVLTKMELTGIYVDVQGTLALVEEVNRLSDEKRGYIASELGDTIEINPETGLPEMVVNKDLGSHKETLAQLKNYGRKKGILELQYLTSTSKNAFREIEEQIDLMDAITEFRSLQHTKDNFCHAIIEYHVDGRIHSNFTQLGKECTRMSSSNPNVQNLSRPGEWKKDKHATWEEAFASWTPKEKLRTLFIPAPGKRLYDCDYSAIELVGIAYMSQDTMMVKAINEGVDLHSLTANRLFGLGYTYDDLKVKEAIKEFKAKYGKERQVGKTFNFQVGYGSGPRKLAYQLRVDAGIYDMGEDQTRSLKEEWLALFPGVLKWQEDILHQVNNFGYVTTLMGRNIYFNEPERAYSKAFNTPVQASCYEGLQMGAIIFDRKVKELEQKEVLKKDSIRLNNLIHDEFYVETDDNIAEKSVIKLVTGSMLDGIQPMFETKEINGKLFEKLNVSAECSRILRWSDKA